jgi:MFS superfamily sulfate permease-like transporter
LPVRGTQSTGIVAAAAIALALLAFAGVLAAIPRAALSAVLVAAAFALFDWRTMAAIRRIDSREFWIAMTATIGVIAVGVISAILVAVVLALVSFVRLTARPQVDRLGTIAGEPGFHPLARHPEATSPPGLVLVPFRRAGRVLQRVVLQARGAEGGRGRRSGRALAG